MIKQFFNDESGATMVEYAILVALIAIAVIVIIGVLGGQLNDVFTEISNRLGAALPVEPPAGG